MLTPLATFYIKVNTEILSGKFANSALSNKTIWSIGDGIMCIQPGQRLQGLVAAKSENECPAGFLSFHLTDSSTISPSPCSNFQVERIGTRSLRIELESSDKKFTTAIVSALTNELDGFGEPLRKDFELLEKVVFFFDGIERPEIGTESRDGDLAGQIETVLPFFAEHLTLGRALDSRVSVGGSAALLDGVVQVIAHSFLDESLSILSTNPRFVADTVKLNRGLVVFVEGGKRCNPKNEHDENMDIQLLVSISSEKGMHVIASAESETLDVKYPFDIRPVELRVSIYQVLKNDPVLLAIISLITLIPLILKPKKDHWIHERKGDDQWISKPKEDSPEDSAQ